MYLLILILIRPPDAVLVLIRFNYDAFAKFLNLSVAVIAFLLLIPYVTL